MTNSGALDAWDAVSPMQPPPATVQAAVLFEPRRRSLTPRSIAFVSLAASPPHEIEPAGQGLRGAGRRTPTGAATRACASLHATSGPVSPVVVVRSVSAAGGGACGSVPCAARRPVATARAAD